MIHQTCKSYQKGIGCGKVVQEISHKLKPNPYQNPNGILGFKADLSKYFDSVPIEFIDDAFDQVERKIGKSKVITVLRKYYHTDLCFDPDGNLIEHYQSLKQGCAVASFLADVMLFHIDFELYKYSFMNMASMSCMEEAIRCSSAWLLSFDKTSTIPAIDYIDTYYDACCWIERIGIGAVSTEHSVMASNYAVDGDEITFVKRLLTELYPNASFSMVSDTYDYWNMIDNILPACKEEIMQHNGKLLVRPDSGDIVEIAVKTIEKLWNVFGGTVNSKGYKVLDPHIGIIYGDGCTLNNVKQVWEELKKKGFAANNIVFGVGAFCFSAVIEPDGHMVVVTRDMFGIAMKATYGIVNGEPIMIYKDPKTDTSHLKKSHKGCCCIYYDDNGELQCEDGYDSIFGNGTLRTVFVDGEACNKETFEDIRERLNGGNKKTKISKITDYLLKDDVIVVMDVDGVLAPYEFSELSHSMTDDEWDKLVASGESPYKDVRPIKLMQKFIQKKGIDKVYTCSKSPSSEIPGKRAFIKNNYNLPDDNIYFTLEKTEKLTVLQTLQQKLGLKPSQIAIVEDTVKTLDYIRAHSDFVTVHVSSFME